MSNLKRFEMSVEVTAVDGSQVFACMAENETEAEQMFKRGECEIIDQQIEVLGLEKTPFAIEESEDISSRLASDIAHAYFERIKELEKALTENATQNRLEGLVITDQNGNTLEWEMCEGVVEVEVGADGLAKENHQEWESGDKAMLDDSEVLVIGYHPEHPLIVIDTGDGLDTVGVSDLKKPNGKV
ncbi:hypothetical protein [Vibrio harveyi]|uniref:hypothetical protein n=1 Tax=Vibrio harveyi TaxID=669 RepID=UPI002380232A|nr:hypothetical protein [Vibrio harveyi]